MKDLSAPEYDAILRSDFWFFAQRCFCQLNPQTTLATNWHLEVIAAKLTAVREGKIRRLIINVAPRNLKSLLASIAFPAWCLGHDPSAQILTVSWQHHDEPVVSPDLSDPPGAASPGGAGIHHHPAGLSARHLHRRRADRTRVRKLTPVFLRLLLPPGGSKWTR